MTQAATFNPAPKHQRTPPALHGQALLRRHCGAAICIIIIKARTNTLSQDTPQYGRIPVRGKGCPATLLVHQLKLGLKS
jgi:hypothetical protein